MDSWTWGRVHLLCESPWKTVKQCPFWNYFDLGCQLFVCNTYRSGSASRGCLNNQAYIAWFTSTRGVYQQDLEYEVLAFFRIKEDPLNMKNGTVMEKNWSWKIFQDIPQNIFRKSHLKIWLTPWRKNELLIHSCLVSDLIILCPY